MKYRIVKTQQGFFRVEREMKFLFFKWWVKIIVATPVGYRSICFSNMETAEEMVKDLRIEEVGSKPQMVIKEYD